MRNFPRRERGRENSNLIRESISIIDGSVDDPFFVGLVIWRGVCSCSCITIDEPVFAIDFENALNGLIHVRINNFHENVVPGLHLAADLAHITFIAQIERLASAALESNAKNRKRPTAIAAGLRMHHPRIEILSLKELFLRPVEGNQMWSKNVNDASLSCGPNQCLNPFVFVIHFDPFVLIVKIEQRGFGFQLDMP